WLAEGGEVTAVLADASGAGSFYVTVDGDPANGDLVHDAAGRTTLSAAAPQLGTRSTVIARLTSGVHRLRLQSDQGGSDWGIDAIVVAPQQGGGWWWLLGPVLGAVAAPVGFLLGRRHSHGRQGGNDVAPKARWR